MDKDVSVAKKLGDCSLICGMMLDYNKFLLGMSGKSLFFYLCIENDDFNFVPISCVNSKIHQHAAPNNPVTKMIL